MKNPVGAVDGGRGRGAVELRAAGGGGALAHAAQACRPPPLRQELPPPLDELPAPLHQARPIAPDEEDLILRLHRLLGNRWSLIAGRIPGRTDNEIKNYWNTHLSKKLISQGIDPRTHKPLVSSNHRPNHSNNPLPSLTSHGLHPPPATLPYDLNPNPNPNNPTNNPTLNQTLLLLPMKSFMQHQHQNIIESNGDNNENSDKSNDQIAAMDSGFVFGSLWEGTISSQVSMVENLHGQFINHAGN
uniref:Uncharacterized protein n=1 Tax=Ananas comosus var. bracteatus TaxID=296719 RepID=A0A6V7QK55_ANACO|nr:unnamed protein product [Ananas comosus var. bracteatus]